MKLLAFLLVNLFLFSTTCRAEASSWAGTWSYVDQKPNESIPYTTFVLKLKKQSEDNLVGSYCLITQAGGKIDCGTYSDKKNVSGQISPSGKKAKFIFYSFFYGKKFSAEANKNGEKITWIAESSYPFPKKMVLNHCNNVSERTLKNKTTNVYDKPSAHAPVIRVLHRNDQIILEDLSSDQKFWKVKFSPSNSRPPIIGWVKLTAVPDNCGE